ncbi:hypothetical protein MPSEU_000414700 [Mayamaea pseudoterrestris]|nr:hypothetical protein MPSEU_000414700 [Mayamaea pseudoterrestris]
MKQTSALPYLLAMLLALALTELTTAFVVAPSQVAVRQTMQASLQLHAMSTHAIDLMQQQFLSSISSSSLTLGASTVDPTSFLSNVLGSLLNTPIILLVPIFAALGVAGLLAFLLVKSSEPEEDE